MMNTEPKWRRRKTARPGEIIEAALEVFTENGFAGAKLNEVARRAGVSKGALYVYFETKEDLFRAVVRTAIAPNLDRIKTAAETFDGPFATLVPVLLANGAALMNQTRLPAVVKMVIGESRNFPDLARIWHDDVVSPIVGVVTGLIVRAQARGEIASGDPRLHAISILGPLLMGMLFRETFGQVTADLPNLNILAAQHTETVLHGLLTHPEQGGKS
jgi:AcrR family transcriptional regulator